MNCNDKQTSILVVDDEMEYREVLKRILVRKGYVVKTASSGIQALRILKEEKFGIVLSDLVMEGMNGVELLSEIKKCYKDVEVILVTGYGTIENAVEAMKKGAFTYFVKSHDIEELINEINKIEELILLSKNNNNSKVANNSSEFILDTNSRSFRQAIEIAEKAARSNVNILLLGESGVGKEIFARHIHFCSDRRDNDFIPVNCSALSSTLLESELFGHERGSFTGAISNRKGRFETSNKGSLFLDEVGDIPLDTQVKLLRVLETKAIERIGSNESIPIDFRLICATNKDLKKEIQKIQFREDLYYRISTITIEIPPLRDRKEDLPMLIDFFLEKSKKAINKDIVKIEKAVSDFLLSYDYPGNIRELKNIIDRLVVLSEDGVISKDDLPTVEKPYIDTEDMEGIKPLRDMRKEVEAEYIQKVIELCDDNISEAARKLGISRRQLFNKISEYGLK